MFFIKSPSHQFSWNLTFGGSFKREKVSGTPPPRQVPCEKGGRVSYFSLPELVDFEIFGKTSLVASSKSFELFCWPIRSIREGLVHLSGASSPVQRLVATGTPVIASRADSRSRSGRSTRPSSSSAFHFSGKRIFLGVFFLGCLFL